MYKINSDIGRVIHIGGKWRLLYYSYTHSTWKVIVDENEFSITSNLEYSAHNITYYANYKGYACQVLGIRNNTFSLDPSIEYQSMSGNHAMHGYDPQLEVKENEVTDIWEERTPIEGFKFDVEPIVYLKKDGVWLVE